VRVWQVGWAVIVKAAAAVAGAGGEFEEFAAFAVQFAESADDKKTCGSASDAGDSGVNIRAGRETDAPVAEYGFASADEIIAGAADQHDADIRV